MANIHSYKTKVAEDTPSRPRNFESGVFLGCLIILGGLLIASSPLREIICLIGFYLFVGDMLEDWWAKRRTEQ